MFDPFDMSLLWGLGGFMKGGSEKDRVGQNAQWMAERDADAVRTLYEVDWSGGPYGGKIQGSASALADYLDWMYGDFGLRVKVTAQAGSPRVDAIGEEILQAVAGREHTVLMLEGTNEQYASRADAVRLARSLMRSGIPTSVGWGTAGAAEVRAIGDEAGTTVDTLHLERTPPPQRRDRQCWDFHECRRAGDNGEFAGPGSSVAEETDPFHLAAQRAGGIVCGGSKYCLHTGSMVYGVGYQGPTGPRYANVWEIPDIEAMVEAVRGVDRAIEHVGMANWARTNNPIPMEVNQGQVDKQYFAISGQAFVAILTDTHGQLGFRQNRPIAEYGLYHPATGERMRGDELNAYVLRGTLA